MSGVSLRELVRLVAAEGLSLHGCHIDDDDISGYYSPSERRIYFDLRLTMRERRSTVAHELGHHHYGHDCSQDAWERQADTYAARLLVHPDDYVDAARVNPDREFIADELMVEAYVIEAFELHVLPGLFVRASAR